jgi:hypothetical protein
LTCGPFTKVSISKNPFRNLLLSVISDVFIHHDEQKKEAEELLADATYELVDQASMYWQTTEAPAEHILTSYDLPRRRKISRRTNNIIHRYDIIFRSDDEPLEPSRADFLTGTKINSKRGYRAASQGRLNIGDLGEDAKWAHNLLPTLNGFDQDISSDIQQTVDNLRQYDLKPSDTRSPMSYRIESDAREQLALDLKLSTDIFSSRSLMKQTELSEAEGLETLTETMSLGSEPHSVEFQYLRPRAGGREFPIGVRSLLQEWGVGNDPEKYVFREPDGAPSPKLAHNSFPEETQPQHPPVQPPTIARPKAYYPPVVVATQRAPPLVTTSQPTSNNLMFQTQLQTQPVQNFNKSQPLVISNTQVVPGPFGGRPQVKKPAKKRIGGF